jgi:hypothetical protein
MICIEDFKARDDLGVMSCLHRFHFHQGCLLEWLTRSRLCSCCPAKGTLGCKCYFSPNVGYIVLRELFFGEAGQILVYIPHVRL